jgi:quercetin dioxygenase-like cupin family protein
MDVRTADVAPTVEHGGTVKSYFLFEKDELYQQSLGSFLEFVCEFEVAAGEKLEPHHHDTHEFYYVLQGEGIMQIESEQRGVRPGHLVHIPRKAGHSIWSTVPGQSIRCLAFGVSFQRPGTQCVVTTLPVVDGSAC